MTDEELLIRFYDLAKILWNGNGFVDQCHIDVSLRLMDNFPDDEDGFIKYLKKAYDNDLIKYYDTGERVYNFFTHETIAVWSVEVTDKCKELFTTLLKL